MTELTVNDLWGVWSLRTWRRHDVDGSVSTPLGERGGGRLIYESSGKMAALLMPGGWPTSTEPPGVAFTAYSGGFYLKDGSVHHVVDLATLRTMVGATLPRKASITADGALVLEAAPTSADPKALRHVLEWIREA